MQVVLSSSMFLILKRKGTLNPLPFLGVGWRQGAILVTLWMHSIWPFIILEVKVGGWTASVCHHEEIFCFNSDHLQATDTCLYFFILLIFWGIVPYASVVFLFLNAYLEFGVLLLRHPFYSHIWVRTEYFPNYVLFMF